LNEKSQHYFSAIFKEHLCYLKKIVILVTLIVIVLKKEINKVEFTISFENSIVVIERIFIPKKYRGESRAKPALKKLIKYLENKYTSIFCCVLPDSDNGKNNKNTIARDYNILRHIFSSVGFVEDSEFKNNYTHAL
jgi:hypothetical protein